MSIRTIQETIKQYANPIKASSLQKFFQTHRNGYGEGDKFLGIIVPNIRKIAKTYRDIPLIDIQKLLDSIYHEYRMTGLYILIYQYEKADETIQKKLYKFYLKSLQAVNNWDLVDTTTPNIMGHYIYHHLEQKKILYKLVISKNLWKRRIAILATYYFIRKENVEDTLKISKLLLEVFAVLPWWGKLLQLEQT